MHIACGKYLNVKVIGNSIIFRSWFSFIMEILGYECLITNSSPWAGKGVSDPAPNGRSFSFLSQYYGGYNSYLHN